MNPIKMTKYEIHRKKNRLTYREIAKHMNKSISYIFWICKQTQISEKAEQDYYAACELANISREAEIKQALGV